MVPPAGWVDRLGLCPLALGGWLGRCAAWEANRVPPHDPGRGQSRLGLFDRADSKCVTGALAGAASMG